MIRLVGLLGRLGLRWMALGALTRYVARRFGRNTVERASQDLEAKAHERLPAPLAKAVSSLPPEAINIGGSAVVAGRAARGAVVTTRRAGQLAAGGTRRANAGFGAARSVLDQLRSQSDAEGRALRARYLEATIGPGAATEALLDTRRVDDGHLGYNHPDDDPHDGVPDAVSPGRRRHRRTPMPVVNRMRRGYRPRSKPWD